MLPELELTTTTDEPQICLHQHQWQVFHSNARFRVLVAGRRFGKTELALAEILRAAQGGRRTIWYVGPNDGQSKRIVWDRLKERTRPWCAKPPNETDLRIDLTSGSTIFVNGAFNPNSLRGNGLDFIVLDEFAHLPPSAWNSVFRPALADRQGRALFIGTPQGRDHFHDHFEYAKTDPDWQAFQFTTAQGGLVDPAELAAAARHMDEESYRREFEAQFNTLGRNLAYYAFNREVNVQSVSFDVMHPLVWAIDFNVSPMCMLLMQRVGDMVHVLEEIVIPRDANTEAACQAFLQRGLVYEKRLPYCRRPLAVKLYGDVSGNQRRTSAASTDWTIIKHFFRSWVGTFEPSYWSASANPLVRDRVNCVNSRLRNQLEESHLLIDPNCKELIKDLELVSWAVDNTNTPTCELNKSDKSRTHASDALGYFISQAFPLKPKIGEQSAGRII